MGGPQVQQNQPTLSSEQLRLQEEARADRITAIQDRTGAETRDLLIRFGRNRAFGSSGSSTATNSPLTEGTAAGLFAGRKLDLLRGLGRL